MRLLETVFALILVLCWLAVVGALVYGGYLLVLGAFAEGAHGLLGGGLVVAGVVGFGILSVISNIFLKRKP